MADESVLFRHGDVVVTPTRFMVGSKTYAIRNIASSRGVQVRPGCLGRLIGEKMVYGVFLATSAGQIDAYSSKDPKVIEDLLEALDRAIVGGQ